MGLLIAKSAAGGLIIFLILLGAQRGQSTLAALGPMIPLGTLIGLLAFASAGGDGAARRFVTDTALALPVWCAFTFAALLALRLGAGGPAAALIGLAAWLIAALIFLHIR